MNFRNFLLYFFAVLLFLPAFASAQSKSAARDLVTVSRVDFKKMQKSDIIRSNGQWIRVEIMLSAASDAEKKTSNNASWIRNVGVTLTLVYEDNKDTSARKNMRQKVVMRESVKLFAIEANKETPVAFYIPPEAYSVYGIQKADPFLWSIDLSVDGAKIPLSNSNYKSLLSRKIYSSGGNVQRIYDTYLKLVDSSSKANKGVLLPVSKTPIQVQLYEINNQKNANLPLPTYIAD